MENEDFDEALKNQIKQVFEDYNDGQANEGWKLLREKYPEKNNRKYFFRWLSSAAVLLLALLFWVFQPEIQKVKVVNISKQPASDSAKTLNKSYLLSKKSVTKIDSLAVNQPKKTLLKTAYKFNLKPKPTHSKTTIADQNITNGNQKTKFNDAVFTDAKLDSTNKLNLQILISDLPKADSASQNKSQPINPIQNPSAKPEAKKEVTKTAAAKKPLSKLSKFGLSIYAGPHVNFATGSNSLLGFGAGIMTDVQVSKKIKLVSGLNLINNKLSYQNNSSNNYALSQAYSASNSAVNVINSNTSLKSLDATFIQLDIPINLIYNILLGKNSISVLAGLSSGTFIKESYQYNYENAADNLKSSKSFQSFYLLKALNVAAQFELPIKKYNLQVEPFVKVPLGNVATQQLKFGAAGINLKFNLQQLKK